MINSLKTEVNAIEEKATRVEGKVIEALYSIKVKWEEELWAGKKRVVEMYHALKEY